MILSVCSVVLCEKVTEVLKYVYLLTLVYRPFSVVHHNGSATQPVVIVHIALNLLSYIEKVYGTSVGTGLFVVAL